MLKLSSLLRLRTSLLNDSLSWYTMNTGMSSECTTAYSAGYEQGFRDAVATLKLNANLQIDTER